jgi:hypothetical protein
MYSHCNERRADARQQEGEFVRVPYAEMSLYPVPAGTDEEALVMLSTFSRPAANAALSAARRFGRNRWLAIAVEKLGVEWGAPCGIYTNRIISRTASLLPFAIFSSARPLSPARRRCPSQSSQWSV